jgi:hypothetical protein
MASSDIRADIKRQISTISSGLREQHAWYVKVKYNDGTVVSKNRKSSSSIVRKLIAIFQQNDSHIFHQKKKIPHVMSCS